MINKPFQAKEKRYETAFASASLPTPAELKEMLASGLDPASGHAVREFRRSRQLAPRGQGTGNLHLK